MVERYDLFISTFSIDDFSQDMVDDVNFIIECVRRNCYFLDFFKSKGIVYIQSGTDEYRGFNRVFVYTLGSYYIRACTVDDFYIKDEDLKLCLLNAIFGVDITYKKLYKETK